MEVDPPPPSQDDPSLVPSTSSGHGQMDQCPSEIQDNQEDFLQTGRVGRRNAIPDLNVDTSSTVSTADLPLEMQKLSCTDQSKESPGPSSSMDT